MQKAVITTMRTPVASLEPHPGALPYKRYSNRQRPDRYTGVTMTIAKLEADGEKLDRGAALSLGGLDQLRGCSQPQPGIDMQFGNNAGENVPMIGWLGAHLVSHTPVQAANQHRLAL